MPFRIHALSEATLAQVRATATDVSGSPVVALTADGDEPLRCCLRNATPGEALILFGHEPPIAHGSPYREIGAVFAHAKSCGGFLASEYPTSWRDRRQVLRAYDARGWIRDAIVHDGDAPEAAIAQLFGDPDVVQLHSRNVAYGCFMFAVTRA